MDAILNCLTCSKLTESTTLSLQLKALLALLYYHWPLLYHSRALLPEIGKLLSNILSPVSELRKALPEHEKQGSVIKMSHYCN